MKEIWVWVEGMVLWVGLVLEFTGEEVVWIWVRVSKEMNEMGFRER